jgi:hypothetical protein
MFEVALPNGERGTAVMYTTHQPPALATADGAIQYRLVTEQYLKGLGLRPLAIEAREIGLDERRDPWEALCRQLGADAARLVAANDPRLDMDV